MIRIRPFVLGILATAFLITMAGWSLAQDKKTALAPEKQEDPLDFAETSRMLNVRAALYMVGSGGAL